MFEKRLEEISKEFNSGEEKEFFILTHKKHYREIYFQDNKRAISYIKNKFYSKKKSIISSFFYLLTYSLIKAGLLQPFLRKIKLLSNFGQVIFVGEQIKSFDLQRRIVLSFLKEESQRGLFLKSKKFQRKMAEKGFAPLVHEINEEFPCAKEELLEVVDSKNYIKPFKKILLFYKESGIKEVSVKEYINNLKKRVKKSKIQNKEIDFILKKLSNKKGKLLVTTLHGDFAKEQILIREDGVVFTDWNPKKGLIIDDLVNFFRGEKRLLKNKKFLEILKEVFPQEVQENIGLYIVLNEISKILKDGEVNELSMERIKRYHHRFFLLKINPPKKNP